jgi:hypothetical protein
MAERWLLIVVYHLEEALWLNVVTVTSPYCQK